MFLLAHIRNICCWTRIVYRGLMCRLWELRVHRTSDQFTDIIEATVAKIHRRTGGSTEFEYGLATRMVTATYPLDVDAWYDTFRHETKAYLDCKMFYYAISRLSLTDCMIYMTFDTSDATFDETTAVSIAWPLFSRFIDYCCLQTVLPGCCAGYICDVDRNACGYWLTSTCNFKGHWIIWAPTADKDTTVSMGERGIEYKSVETWKRHICDYRTAWAQDNEITLPDIVRKSNTPDRLRVYWMCP